MQEPESSDVCGVNVQPKSCRYQPLPFTDETESFFRPKFFRLAVKLFRLSFVGVGVASPEASPSSSTSLSSTNCESSTITTSFCIESSTVPEIPPPPTRRTGAASASSSDSMSSACIKTGESSPDFAGEPASVNAVGIVGDVGSSKSGIGAVGDAACNVSGESVNVLEGGEAARMGFVGDVTGGETTRRGVTEATDDEGDDVSNCIELPASRSSASCCAANEGESSAAGVGSSKGSGAGGFVTEIIGKGGRGAAWAWFVTFPNGS